MHVVRTAGSAPCRSGGVTARDAMVSGELSAAIRLSVRSAVRRLRRTNGLRRTLHMGGLGDAVRWGGRAGARLSRLRTPRAEGGAGTLRAGPTYSECVGGGVARTQ